MLLRARHLLPSLLLLLSPGLVHAQGTPGKSPYNDGVARSAPMDHKDKAPIPPSRSLNVTFQGDTTTLSLEDLTNLPQTTVHVHNAHADADEVYTGPLLSVVLARAGLTAGKATEPLILHSAVLATGTDGYFVLFSAAETMPAFSRSQVIVAVMKSGLPDEAGGLIQLINTDGAKPARWVHGLANLNVVSMTP